MDRLLDTRKELIVELPRHRFHMKNSRILFFVSLVLIIISARLLPRVEESIIKIGLLMSVIMGIYLFLVWKKVSIPKEIIIALMYTSGVALAPIVLSEGEIKWMLLFQHSTLAFTNLVIISWFERVADRSNGVYNITNRLDRRTPVLINSLFFIFLACGFFSGLEHGWSFQVPLILMWGTFVMIWSYRKLFSRDELYGMVADGAFFLPALVVLF